MNIQYDWFVWQIQRTLISWKIALQQAHTRGLPNPQKIVLFIFNMYSKTGNVLCANREIALCLPNAVTVVYTIHNQCFSFYLNRPWFQLSLKLLTFSPYLLPIRPDLQSQLNRGTLAWQTTDLRTWLLEVNTAYGVVNKKFRVRFEIVFHRVRNISLWLTLKVYMATLTSYSGERESIFLCISSSKFLLKVWKISHSIENSDFTVGHGNGAKQLEQDDK